MRDSFRWKLTGTYLLIIIIILFIFGLLLTLTFKDYYFRNVESSLLYESRLVAGMTAFYDKQVEIDSFMQDICNTAARKTDTRITIMDKDGRVAGDSNYNPDDMEIHKSRPEVFQALQEKTGVAKRYSTTAGVNMLYVAIPVDNPAFTGVVRLARPLTEVEAGYHQVLYILLLAILLTGLITFLISMKVSERFSRPIRELTVTVKEMAQGKLKKRIHYQANDELSILATAVNNMAENLDKNINEISEVKNRLEILLNNTVNGILMIDMGGRITYANPMALSLLSINVDYLGRKYGELISNYQLMEMIDKVKEEGGALRRQLLLHSLGERIVEVNAVMLNNKERNSQDGVLLVLNDISEIKRLEQVRQDFVANVSHELKTPVATISGFAETLLSEVEEYPENIQEFSQIIYDESQRLKRLIDKLLELSKLESGHFELNMVRVFLPDLIDNAIDLAKKAAAHKKVLIDFQRPQEDIYIEGDEVYIVQVLLNLLDNAIKYSPEGKIIKVILKEEENAVKVSVLDQGDGIADKEIGRVFERFYRVDKARSRKTGGSGLGLAIVKHLVENHGGQVGVKSRPGEGTMFFFTLPKKQPFK